LDDRLEAYPTAVLDDRLEAYPTCESVTTHYAIDRLRFLVLVDGLKYTSSYLLRAEL
jgi:hypothetical protein